MVNKQKKALVLGAMTLGSLYGGLFFNTEEVEAARRDCSRPDDALVPVWEGEANPKEDPPTYLELNTCASNMGTYNWYTNTPYNPWPNKADIRFFPQEHIISEELKAKGYPKNLVWYSPVLPYNMNQVPGRPDIAITEDFYNPLMIRDNHFPRSGALTKKNFNYILGFVYSGNDAGINYNLKEKSMNPFKDDIFSIPTTKAVDYKLKGNMVEFRYLGYGPNGNIVDNPYFPDDVPDKSGRFAYEEKNWISKPWENSLTSHKNNIQATIWDYIDVAKKRELFEKYLFPNYPKMLETHTKDYWVNALSLRSDPETGLAVATGYHLVGNTPWYKSFVLSSPQKSNLRLSQFQVVDPNGNRIIGVGSRDRFTKNKVNVDNYKINGTLSVGYTYKIEANITKTQGTHRYNETRRTPLAIDLEYRYGNNKFQPRPDDGRPIYGQAAIKTGQEVRFNKGTGGGTWEFRLRPEDAKSNMLTLSAKIPNGFYQRGDNIDLRDDRIDLVFNVVQENMALSKNIKMIDKNGKSVDYVVPNRPYTFKMDVSKVSGQYPVKDATVIVKVTDGGYEKTMKAVAKTSLTKPGDTVTVETIEPFYPSTSQVTISAIIDPKHHTQRIENVYKKEEDGEFIRKIESNIDVKVNELEVSPHPTFLQSTETKGKSPYKVDFDMFNENAEGQAKAIMVRIKRNNEVIHQEKVVVPPNQKERVSFITKELPVTKGSKDKFSVEVNAPDENGVREWYEYYKGKTNPYDNNVAEATVPVLAHNAPKKVYCAVPKTSYEWKQKYNVTKLNGSFQNQTAIRYLANGKTQNVSVKEFVGSSLNRNSQTVTHKETYSFTSVQFRSKHTDNKWVELMDAKTNNVIADAEKKAVVKAGEGFDLIIKTKYTNNIPQTSPAATYTATASTFVSPAYRIHNVPEQMSVHLPFKGKDGNPFSLNIEGKQEGTWNNETQTYEMPLREKFGKETRKIFIGKNVKNGVYEVRIDTASIAGTPDKPKEVGAYLCDSKRFPLTVVGSNTDDVKSHITQ